MFGLATSYGMLTTNQKIIILIILIVVGGSAYLYYNRQVNETTALPSSTPYATDKIILDYPLSGSIVTSPLVIHGKARGSWFFEASFPVKLFDANGNIIASGPAQAQSDWMTTEFVPFEITLTFIRPAKPEGILFLEKDNPSGLMENAESISIPIRFNP